MLPSFFFVFRYLSVLNPTLLVNQASLLIKELVIRGNDLPFLVYLNGYFDLFGLAREVLGLDLVLKIVLQIKVRHFEDAYQSFHLLKLVFELVYQFVV